jgi:hypothetical protein
VEEDDGGAKTKKKVTFAEAVEKEATQAQRIKCKKCVVGFAIRVNKGNNTKGGFNKNLTEGLTFMQTYIDKHASFHPIGKDQTAKPIKEKTDMPKCVCVCVLSSGYGGSVLITRYQSLDLSAR